MTIKPLSEFHLCEQCCAELDAIRQRGGAYGRSYCLHRGIYGAWNAGDLILRECASEAQAEQFDRQIEAAARHAARVAALLAVAPSSSKAN